MTGRSRNQGTTGYIRAIDRLGSISAAADELGISQPALSSYLKKTEDRLGASIFDRATTPLSLTDAGKAYLDCEQQIEGIERVLRQRISDLEDLRCGELSVGSTTSLDIALLPRAITEFSTLYPGIDVSVVDDTLPNLARAAIDGTIDVFIATSMQDNGAFDCLELRRERVFLCVPAMWEVCSQLPEPNQDGYATITGKQIKLLDGCPFIMMHDDQQIGNRMNELLDAYGITPGRIIRANQALTSFALTAEGAGVSLVTEAAMKYCRMKNPPRLYYPNEEICTRMLYIACPRNRSMSRAAEAFIDVLRNTSFDW